MDYFRNGLFKVSCMVRRVLIHVWVHTCISVLPDFLQANIYAALQSVRPQFGLTAC